MANGPSHDAKGDRSFTPCKMPKAGWPLIIMSFWDLLAHSSTTTGREDAKKQSLGYPEKGLLLPNVQDFYVDGKTVDEYAKVFEIDRALDRQYRITLLNHNAGNKFLRKAFGRLARYAEQGEVRKFETLAKIILTQSISYRISCLFHVRRTWYKDLPINKLKRALWEVSQLSKGWKKGKVAPYAFKRVFIPKADGSLRPLAVPSLGWRIWANMCYKITWIWISRFYPEWQHGARPGRGVNTCWKSLWDRIQDKSVKYIYEFDLTKFFDLVRHESIQEMLNVQGVPGSINRNLMALISKPKSDLSYQAKKEEWSHLKEAHAGSTQKIEGWDQNSGMYKVLSGNKVKTPWTADQAGFGVPQGFSISPLLACATLANDLEQCRYTSAHFGAQEGLFRSANDQILMYMDDGLILSNEPLDGFGLLTDLEMAASLSGTGIHPKKSRYLMKDGKWLVSDFKFLGVKYIPGTDWLEAKTRNGATMPFPGADVEKMDLRGPSSAVFIRYLESHGEIATAQRYGIFNAILSKMWNKNDEKYVSDHLLVYAPKSFCSHYIERMEEKFAGRPKKINISSYSSRLLEPLVLTWCRKRRVNRGRPSRLYN